MEINILYDKKMIYSFMKIKETRTTFKKNKRPPPWITEVKAIKYRPDIIFYHSSNITLKKEKEFLNES